MAWHEGTENIVEDRCNWSCPTKRCASDDGRQSSHDGLVQTCRPQYCWLQRTVDLFQARCLADASSQILC